MPAPRHIRTLLVALLVAALGLGVAAPSQAKESSEQRADRVARNALHADRKAATADGKAPAVIELRGVVLTAGNPMVVAVQNANLEQYRGKEISIAFHKDAFVSLNGKQARLAAILKDDRVKITGLPVKASSTSVTAYLARFERRNPKPVKLQGKVTELAADGLKLFAKDMSQKITFATESAVVLRNRKAVSDTNKIAVGDHCSVAGFPVKDQPNTVAAYYVSCKSMPAKGKPAEAPAKGKPQPTTAK